MYKYLIYFFVLAVLSSCSDRDGDTAETLQESLSVTLVTSLNGAGDNGYNDLILSGALKFYQEHENVNLSLVWPHNMEEAELLLSSWMEKESEERQLLILGGNEYEQIVREKGVTLNERKTILLFESEAIPNVNTIRIQRYGVSYLAGCIVAPEGCATIIAAMPNDPILMDAISGFSDGFNKYYNEDDVEDSYYFSTGLDTIYLANDYTGYAMPDSTYRLVTEINNGFIYPLAGGSNNGVYKSIRDNHFALTMAIGMDADCSAHGKSIPFSVIIRTDKLVEDYLTMWVDGEALPLHSSYGLEDGYADIVISPYFYDMNIQWKPYYEIENYWEDAYHKYISEAIEKEREYEER